MDEPVNTTNKEINNMAEDQNSTKEMRNNLKNCTALVVSFDTTGSMRSCIGQVRQKLRDLIEMMTVDIPDLKVGLIAHGDYCDGDNCIAILDLTNDLEKIMNFIANTPNTGGGDAPECYEYALQTANGMSWPKEGGSLVLIGDDEPHEQNPNNIDWRKEVAALLEKNVKVFPMQCLYSPHRSGPNKFWEEISGLSGTPLLMLESFSDSSNVLEAVAYSAAGEEAFKNYKMRYDSEVAGGLRACSTSNMAENQSKLEAYASNIKKKEK